MQIHALVQGRRYALIDTDMKYQKIDNAAVAATRRAAMVADKKPAPKMSCNFCGFTVGKGALWCSTDCANDYEAERRALTVEGG